MACVPGAGVLNCFLPPYISLQLIQVLGVMLTQVGKPDIPRGNFDDIQQALITIFQLLTFDNWADVCHDTMQASTWLPVRTG